MKIGSYYLVDLNEVWGHFVRETGEQYYIGKFLGPVTKYMEEDFDYGFEFLIDVGSSHNCGRCPQQGKLCHCLYVNARNVVRKLYNDEIFVELL